MGNANYKKGADKERRIVKRAKDAGKLAFRSAGSHSPIDCFILDTETKEIELLQCKPRSMSENEKDRILETLKQYEGVYTVRVGVV